MRYKEENEWKNRYIYSQNDENELVCIINIVHSDLKTHQTRCCSTDSVGVVESMNTQKPRSMLSREQRRLLRLPLRPFFRDIYDLVWTLT